MRERLVGFRHAVHFLALLHRAAAAFRGLGAAVKKREDTHKMAESNKAFAHYRW